MEIDLLIQSGVINEILLEVLILFSLSFAAYFHLVLENICAAKINLLHHIQLVNGTLHCCLLTLKKILSNSNKRMGEFLTHQFISLASLGKFMISSAVITGAFISSVLIL